MADEDPQPNATVYVRNLNESIKIPALIEGLRGIFAEYGTIVDIVAKKSLKRKGQAFIVFDNPDSAEEAIEDLQNFDLFGTQINVAFAKTRSDATVQKEEGEAGLEAHKKQRIAEKERKQALEAAQAKPAKRDAPDGLAERPAKSSKPAAGAPTANAAVPDEYLPPNKVLFIRDLPPDYGKDNLTTVFSRFPGLKEIRTVPVRNTIAFAEYEDENAAIAAKAALAGIELGGSKIKVTFQRAG